MKPEHPEFEAVLRRFETAWNGGIPKIEQVLPCIPSGPLRALLLDELVALDLEYRWRLRESLQQRYQVTPPHVEEYARFLNGCDIPLDWIAEEYRCRHRWGDHPHETEFLKRFPEQATELADRLLSVRRDLDREWSRGELGPRGLISSFPRYDPRAPLRFDDYQLEQHLGSGGIGRVYRARQLSLDRHVAIKVLRKAARRDPAAIDRFLEEARLVARLRHPGIVGIHGVGQMPKLGYFLVMDWIDGPNLSHYTASGPVDLPTALRWTAEAAAALAHAHAAGIVHCDLKPANLLRAKDGRIVLTDFGLGRQLTTETVSPVLAGTASYMAPEQAAGCWGEISPRTDIYGLGAVLFELLTGAAPFLGRTVADILAEVVSARPALSPRAVRPEIPREVDFLCRRCLEKDPVHRFADASDLEAMLREQIQRL